MIPQASPVQSSTQPDEWLTPDDVKRIYRWGNTRFWQLVKDGAFAVTRPKTLTGRNTRIVFVRRSDVDAFLNSGYPSA